MSKTPTQHEFVIYEGYPSFTFYSGLQEAFEATMTAGLASQETISMAAIKGMDNTVYVVERPGRHGHIGAYMGKLGVSDIEIPGNTRNQGFLTNHGRYVNRKEGLAIAKAANQILRKTPPENLLFSEDVWTIHPHANHLSAGQRNGGQAQALQTPRRSRDLQPRSDPAF